MVLCMNIRYKQQTKEEMQQDFGNVCNVVYKIQLTPQEERRKHRITSSHLYLTSV